MPTIKDVREKLAAKQDELGKVFSEAKTDDGQYDFNKVTCLGTGVKGSVAVAEQVKAMNAELDALAKEAETLESAEKAARDHADRERVRSRLPMPGAKGDERRTIIKSLGELFSAEKSYEEWVGRGKPQGIDFAYDIYPSDVLAKGMLVETLLTKALMSTSAGYAPESLRLPGFVEAVTRPLQLIDIIPMSQTGSDTVKYMEETTRTHAAAETAEGGAYAESTFVFTEKSSDVRKITDSLPVTDEQMDDVPMMTGYVNGRLTFGIRQRLDTQAYVGNGTAPNLRGIVNVAGIQTQAKGTDPVPDAFFKAMTKIRTTGRAIPTHHVMHATDWQNIRLLRTTDGVYIWGSPSESGPERMWGLPVVQNEARAAGAGLVGSFQPAWISAFERKGVTLQVGYVGTQFTEGKRTVRGDMRVALVVTRPAAFCDVTGL
ncbi:phage major capsid protein [Rhizobium arsenicireducens]